MKPRNFAMSPRKFPYILPSPSSSNNNNSFGAGAAMAARAAARPLTPTDDSDSDIAAAGGGSTSYRHSGNAIPSPVCELCTTSRGVHTKCAKHSGRGEGPVVARKERQQTTTPPSTPIRHPKTPRRYQHVSASTPIIQRKSILTPVKSPRPDPDSPYTPECLAKTEYGPFLAFRGSLAQRQRGYRVYHDDDDDDSRGRGDGDGNSDGDGDSSTEDCSFCSNYFDEATSPTTEKPGLHQVSHPYAALSPPQEGAKEIAELTDELSSSTFSPYSPLPKHERETEGDELASKLTPSTSSSSLSQYKDFDDERPMAYKLRAASSTTSLARSLKRKVSGLMPLKLSSSASHLYLVQKEKIGDRLTLMASRSVSSLSLIKGRKSNKAPPQLPYSESFYDLEQNIEQKGETAVPKLFSRSSSSSSILLPQGGKSIQPAVRRADVPPASRSSSSPLPSRPTYQTGLSPLRRNPVALLPVEKRTETTATKQIQARPSPSAIPKSASLPKSAAANPLPTHPWLSMTPSLPASSALRDYQPPLYEISPRGTRLSVIWSVRSSVAIDDDDDDDDDEQEASGSGSGSGSGLGLGLDDHGAADHEDGYDTTEVGGGDKGGGESPEGRGRDVSFHSQDDSSAKEAEGEIGDDGDGSLDHWRGSISESEYGDAVIETVQVVDVGAARKGKARIIDTQDSSKH